MKNFRIIEIRADEIAVTLDREQGIVPVPDVSAMSQADAIEAYVEAIANATSLSPEMVRPTLKAHMGIL